MKIKQIISLFMVLSCSLLHAQDVSLALQKRQVLNPQENAKQWAEMPQKVAVGFSSSNLRYAQDVVPTDCSKRADTLVAWRGEKVHTQLVVWSKADVLKTSVSVGDLKSAQGHVIPQSALAAGFVGYVLTDEFKSGCGHRNAADFDSSWVADPINMQIKSISLKKNSVQPVWLSVEVPANTPAGKYSGKVKVQADKSYSLDLVVNVLDKTLPASSEWSFNLDFWQHPAAIARVHQVALWSDKHFELMKNYYTMLAKAGQKCITATIIDEAWGHQTYDDFPGLVKWIKKADGSWKYDYSLFDKYVAFVMSCGIDQRINCYSMAPWKIAFTYYDEGEGKELVFTEKIGSEAYNNFWTVMLTDFTKHLKSKGWFERTTIAMDERPMPTMLTIIKLLRGIDPNWKIALAGEYHNEIEADIYDYCIASRFQFPESILESRHRQGKISTWYTCCEEPYPNGFTFSPPAEHVWIGWYTAANNLDGYLRWAYNSWTKEPLRDSRFIRWPAGDTYQIYPGPQTSIRFEKLIEGIQDFQKIEILRNQYKKEGNLDKLNKLNRILATFTIKQLSTQTAEEMLKKAKPILFGADE